MPAALFIVQLASTLMMTGIIWFVQIVHYPLFARVGESGFAAYSQLHVKRTRWVVAPLMVLELGTASAGFIRPLRPSFMPGGAALVGLLLLGVIWLSTALLHVPIHNRLARGFQAVDARKLVVSNWLRTVAWTLRAGLLLWLLWACDTGLDVYRN